MTHPHIIAHINYTATSGRMHRSYGIVLIGPTFPTVPDNVVVWTFLTGPPDRVAHPRWLSGQPVQVRVPCDQHRYGNTLYDIDESVEQQNDELYHRLVPDADP